MLCDHFIQAFGRYKLGFWFSASQKFLSLFHFHQTWKAVNVMSISNWWKGNWWKGLNLLILYRESSIWGSFLSSKWGVPFSIPRFTFPNIAIIHPDWNYFHVLYINNTSQPALNYKVHIFNRFIIEIETFLVLSPLRYSFFLYHLGLSSSAKQIPVKVVDKQVQYLAFDSKKSWFVHCSHYTPR